MATSKVGRPCFNFSILKPLNRTSIKIKVAKYKHLLSLLEYIPPIHHTFYKNVKHDGKALTKKGKKKQTQTLTSSQKVPDIDEPQPRPADSDEENDEDIQILDSDYE
ncbi:unnamed protein product [Acanthoscelides obtectus]|uniref:Uncharacterized protein n=1 Tax=Acanthoscelides obtectus TaxID=200917 RepID=A0A9P0PGK2_ACAOB|nr:unnamed protein product [Acanthoscelides obtectus]CAK1637734.1 hypothetical protein AOBTE_LOCUS10163 [Acanthoscelides obtectus]